MLANVQSVVVSPTSKTIPSCPHHTTLFIKGALVPDGWIEGLLAERKGGRGDMDGATLLLAPGTLICGGQRCCAIGKGLDATIAYFYDALVVVRICGKRGYLIGMPIGIVCYQFQVVRTSREQFQFAILEGGEFAQCERLLSIVHRCLTIEKLFRELRFGGKPVNVDISPKCLGGIVEDGKLIAGEDREVELHVQFLAEGDKVGIVGTIVEACLAGAIVGNGAQIYDRCLDALANGFLLGFVAQGLCGVYKEALSALLTYAYECRGILHHGKTSHIAILHV